jgi:hypothetical protein
MKALVDLGMRARTVGAQCNGKLPQKNVVVTVPMTQAA